MRRWIWRLLGYGGRYWVIRNKQSPDDCPLYLVSDWGIAVPWTTCPRWRKKFWTYADAELAWLGLPWYAKIEEVNTW